MTTQCRTLGACSVVVVLFFVLPVALRAQQLEDEDSPSSEATSTKEQVLDSDQQSLVDAAIDRGLRWLAANHQRDGSFPTLPQGQPGVTSLGVMAFLSAGHTLEGGPHAKMLRQAVDYSLDCQQPSGIISKVGTQPVVLPHNGSHTVFYNHGLTGLMLGEVYGMTDKSQSKRIRRSLPEAIEAISTPPFKKRQAGDEGGWRYFNEYSSSDSDTTSTAWQLMFFRSAKNAGFDVPEIVIDDAIGFIERCYDSELGTFRYGLYVGERHSSVGSVGGAIVSLSMAGKHQMPQAQSAGRWLMRQNFENYNSHLGRGGHYHYGIYYASQAASQLGGAYWRNIYPRVTRVLLENQQQDGSWPSDNGIAECYGNAYTTALAVLALTPVYQLLPIYQR